MSRIIPSFFVLLLIVVIGASITFLPMFSNVQAPAGYAAYITERPLLGKAHFFNVVIGPSSTGFRWRVYGDLVSLTPYSYSEVFAGEAALIAKDKLAISGNSHIVWRIRPGEKNIRNYMEHFGGLDTRSTADQSAKLAYNNYIREPYRTLVREEFAARDGLNIPEALAEMGDTVTHKLQEKLASTPFEVLQVVIGNAQPPAKVLEEIATKVAKTQELARKQTEIEIAKKDMEIQRSVGEAQGNKIYQIAVAQAKANRELTSSLSPMLLQYQAIQNIQGADRVYLPLSRSGMPLVGTIDVEKPAPKTAQPALAPSASEVGE